MRPVKRFLTRLANFAARRRNDERLDDRMNEEIQEHIALQTDANLRAGMPPAEARRQAALKFGASESIKEEYRDERGLPFIDNLLQDLRHGKEARLPGLGRFQISRDGRIVLRQEGRGGGKPRG